MASPAKQPKMKGNVDDDDGNDSVCGLWDSVSCVQTATRNRSKIFNAILQTTRDQYCRVTLFSVDKRSMFLQAEKTGSPVKFKGDQEMRKYSNNVLLILHGLK